MFCGICGTKNVDGVAYCKNCGCRLNAPKKAPANVKTPVAVSKRKRQQDNKKVGMIAVAISAAIVLIILFALFGGRGYKSTVKQFVNAQFEVDAETIFKLIPDKMIDYMLDEEGYDEDELDELIDEANDEIQDQLDSINRYLGEDWEVTYEILSAENLEKEDLKELKEDYEDIDIKVSAAKTVEVELTVKAGETETSNSLDVSLIKVGNTWYLDVESMGGIF